MDEQVLGLSAGRWGQIGLVLGLSLPYDTARDRVGILVRRCQEEKRGGCRVWDAGHGPTHQSVTTMSGRYVSSSSSQ